MTSRAGRGGRLVTIAWALVGVMGGHELTYTVLFPDDGLRHEALAESGHAWVGMLGPALIVSFAVAVAAGLLGRRPAGRSRGVRFAVLLALQVGLFTAIELGERIGAGMTLRSIPHEIAAHGLLDVLALGSLIQVAAAWLGSATSRVVTRLAERLAGRCLRGRCCA